MKRINRFFNKIKRVIDFLPIIWNGEDFDYKYALELFQHQLKRTSKYIDSQGYHMGNQNTANRINTAVELIDKVYDGEYDFESIRKFERLYGKPRIEFIKSDNFESPSGEPMYELKQIFPSAITEEDNERLSELLSKFTRKGMEKTKRAESVLWRFISHNIKNWWD